MDIRGQRTVQAIAESFLELLKQKPASKITVTEICKLCGINRATFYKHYLDVPDLQETLENEVLADFDAFLQACDFSSSEKYQILLLRMLTYLKQYGNRFYLLCSTNAASDLPARLFRKMNDFAFPVMRERIPAVDEGRSRLLYQYICHGCGALLVSWLREEEPMAIQEMSDFIMAISSAAVSSVAGLSREV